VQELGVCYIVVHPTMLQARTREETLGLISRLEGLTRLETRTDVVAFRVDLPSATQRGDAYR
jgi:hypothetical protein